MTLPCNLGGQLDILVRTEVVDADFPLLIGNTLKKALAVLSFNIMVIKLVGKEIALKETNSGHYSISIKPPKG